MTAAEMTRQWIDAFNRHDPAATGALYAPNAVVRDPSYHRPLEGRDAVQRDMEAFMSAFPDAEVRLTHTLEANGSYAVESTFAGTHRGPLVTDSGEIPASGRRMQFDAAGFFRLDGQGRILEEHRYYDLAALAAQLDAR
jgi:steroid delta-isomerase-like uncharacterized protein